jgi:hypothetical protein
MREDTWRAEMRKGKKQAPWMDHGVTRKKPKPKPEKPKEPENFWEAVETKNWPY